MVSPVHAEIIDSRTLIVAKDVQSVVVKPHDGMEDKSQVFTLSLVDEACEEKTLGLVMLKEKTLAVGEKIIIEKNSTLQSLPSDREEETFTINRIAYEQFKSTYSGLINKCTLYNTDNVTDSCNYLKLVREYSCLPLIPENQQ